MVQYWLFALGGGALSASLYLSVVLGSSGAMLLAYLAQLPLFVAALGFGTMAGAAASGAGTLVVALAGGLLAGMLYLLVNGVPVLVMSQRALLSRETAAGEREWYPPGLLLAWLTALGAGAFILVGAILALGQSGLEDSVRSFLSGGMERIASGAAEDDRARLVDLIVPWFPAAVVGSWIIMVTINGALAQGLLQRFRRNLRPAPDMAAIALPPAMMAALGVSLVAWLIADGALGFIGRNVAVIMLVPFFFLGLAVVHAFARASRFRPWLLVSAYGSILLFGWPVVLVAVLGLFEQGMGLRRRIAGHPPAVKE
ncbi:MAG: DUF2232 domain-containing protein [Proteobacteria bacterium]|nr:DUF2232 domain-containing protein [Pseudomonadota bacterium]